MDIELHAEKCAECNHINEFHVFEGTEKVTAECWLCGATVVWRADSDHRAALVALELLKGTSDDLDAPPSDG